VAGTVDCKHSGQDAYSQMVKAGLYNFGDGGLSTVTRQQLAKSASART
jgi:hypothetical protein